MLINENDPCLLKDHGAYIWHKYPLKSVHLNPIHRDNDLPAFISSKNRRVWYYNGVKHRANGPAIIDPSWGREWRHHGVRHRIGGPAVITSNREQYYVNGRLHRLDGPAVISINVYRQLEYDFWINGTLVKDAYRWIKAHRYTIPLKGQQLFHFVMYAEGILDHEHQSV